jgi:hypothetical protein
MTPAGLMWTVGPAAVLADDRRYRSFCLLHS